MFKKIALILSMSTCLFLAASAINAGTTVDDVIKMENKAYSEHKREIVEFTHEKHIQDYGIGCGECHHNEQNEPLNDLKMGDQVDNCIKCHPKPGDRPKGKDAPRLSKSEQLEYHAVAIHDNCRSCHKKYNKDKGLKRKDPGYTPTSCKQCHQK